MPFRLHEPEISQSVKTQAEESFEAFMRQDHSREAQAAEKAAEILKKLNSVSPGMLPEQFQPISSKPMQKHHLALFISSSIPIDTLREYVSQINMLSRKEINVVMYLRGFVQGMKRMGPTVSFYFSLAMKNQAGPVTNDNLKPAGFLIDPESFRKFHITSVPALVDMETGCTASGDASLTKLMENIEENRCGEKAGAVFEIVEKDPVEEIKRAVAGISWAKVRQRLHDNVETALQNIRLGINLPPAQRDSSRLVEFSATLPFDVYDPETDELLYPAGFVFNPLDYVSPQGSLVILNGSRAAELMWIIEKLENDSFERPVRVATIAGSIKELSETLHRPVFEAGTIAEQAVQNDWCRATPCVISFRDRKILAREYALAGREMQ